MDYVRPFRDKQGKWRWRLCSANGNILASSEAYSSRGKARQTLHGLVTRNPTICLLPPAGTADLEVWLKK